MVRGREVRRLRSLGPVLHSRLRPEGPIPKTCHATTTVARCSSTRTAEDYWNAIKDDEHAVCGISSRAVTAPCAYRGLPAAVHVAAAALWQPDRLGADVRVRPARSTSSSSSKYHDGFCLWPTAIPNPHAACTGRVERDLVGELATAVRGARDALRRLLLGRRRLDVPATQFAARSATTAARRPAATILPTPMRRCAS